MRIIKDPMSLVRVAHELIYNHNFISGGGRKYYRDSLAIVEIIIRQIPRRIKDDTQ